MKMKAPRFLKKIMSIISKAKSIADLKNRMRNLKTRFMIYSLLSTDKKVLFGSISNKLQDLVLTHHQSSHHQLAQAVEVEETQEPPTNLINLQQIAPVLYNNLNAAMYPLTITNVNNDQYEDDEEEETMADTRVQEEEVHQNALEEAGGEGEEITNFPISDHEHEEIEQENEREDYVNNQTKNIYPDLRHTLFEDEDLYEMGRPGSVIELVKKSKEAEDGEEFKLEDQIDEVADLFIQRFHRHMWIQKQNSFKRNSENSSTIDEF